MKHRPSPFQVKRGVHFTTRTSEVFRMKREGKGDQFASYMTASLSKFKWISFRFLFSVGAEVISPINRR